MPNSFTHKVGGTHLGHHAVYREYVTNDRYIQQWKNKKTKLRIQKNMPYQYLFKFKFDKKKHEWF